MGVHLFTCIFELTTKLQHMYGKTCLFFLSHALWLASAIVDYPPTPQKLYIQFRPVLNGMEVTTDQAYYASALGDSVSFEKLSFYLSKLAFQDTKGKRLVAESAPYLINLVDSASCVISFPATVPKTGQLNFTLGTDSLMNVTGDYTGALDPLHGMYWSWQSGYINFKLEGKSKACPMRKNRFQLHIGGFRKPFETAIPIALNYSIKDQNDTLFLEMELASVLEHLASTKNFQIMSPGAEAKAFAEILVTTFALSNT